MARTPRFSPREPGKSAGCQLQWLAAGAGGSTDRARPIGADIVCLLWMSGGPSQMDTFDMKPGHANGGEFQEIQTRRAGAAIQ